MPYKKLRTGTSMTQLCLFPKPKLYSLLTASVERACAYASHRAWKHQDDVPSEEERLRIAEVFVQEVLNQLGEDFELNDD